MSNIQKIKDSADYRNGGLVVFVGMVGGQIKTIDAPIMNEPTEPRVNADL